MENKGAGKYVGTSAKGIGQRKVVSGGTTSRRGPTKGNLPKNGNKP